MNFIFFKSNYKLKNKSFIYKKKHNKNIFKEVKFNFNISDNDINIKIRKIKIFIKKKNNVKISIFMRGREIYKTELIMKVINKIKNKLLNEKINFTNLKRNSNIYSFSLVYKK